MHCDHEDSGNQLLTDEAIDVVACLEALVLRAHDYADAEVR